MKEDRHYTDLLKDHKLYTEIEERWKFYDTYIKHKNPKVWFKSGDIPCKEGLLLFGFINSWEPNFQGNLLKFLEIYKKDIFPKIKKFEHTTIVKVDFSDEVKNSISKIFNEIAMCPREKRFESTAASKILHAIIPNLFVMWDDKIRKEIVGDKGRKGRYNGRDYAFVFLPKMQELAKEYLDTYVKENGDDYESATLQISKMAHNYSLTKLIDEYNYVIYTRGKSLIEIRNTTL